MEITQKLVAWYLKNHRDLPWRNISDPYKIWLSEVILQQTRINQGLNYYQKFVENYPTVTHLANAPEDEILKLWQGLGYYSRARNLHKAAKIISKEFKGEFPQHFNQIINLPGIGPYTAAAISSIAFGEPFPVIDGNVLRVISRLFAIGESVDSGTGRGMVNEVLKIIIDKKNPGIFNQAMMEFGATWCTPQHPDCQNCIFVSECLAFLQKKVDTLPVKSKKPKQKVRFFNYLDIGLVKENNRFVYLRKRTGNDIWKGLYDFPLIETSEEVSPEVLMTDLRWMEVFAGQNPVVTNVSKQFIHLLTHQKIMARFIEIQIDTPLIIENFVELNAGLMSKYPIPRLMERYLKNET